LFISIVYLTALLQNVCYCALDIIEEKQILNSSKAKERLGVTVETKNGELSLVGERFLVTENLFTGNVIQSVIVGAINDCDYSDKQYLWGNIVLSGKTSMIAGLPERLEKELSVLAPHKSLNIIYNPDRDNAACTGASMLISSASYYTQINDLTITLNLDRK